ncbi:MAG: hypothetical protein ABIZ50_06990 [Solirubrobacterales bacterium]
MKRGIRGRVTYANVMSTVAVFLALGGGAYAISKLPAKSVGRKQIQKSAVVSSKVKDQSLLGKDFKPGELPQGKQGDQGLTGVQGPPGPTASSFSSHAPAAQSITSGTQSETQVMELTDGASGGLLTIGFSGRILVNASISLRNSDLGASSNVYCRLKIAPQGGPFTPISNFTSVLLGPDPLAQDRDSSAQVPLVGAVDEPPGTYNVNVGCTTGLGGGNSVVFEQGDLTAVATAR